MINSENMFFWAYCHTEQMEENDCGIACIVMMLNYYGFEESIEKVKEKIKIDEDGITMFQMSKYLTGKGCRTMGVKANFGQLLNDFQFPLIAHYEEEKHYVVVWEVDCDFVCLSNPSLDALEIVSKDDFCERWKGVCLLIE